MALEAAATVGRFEHWGEVAAKIVSIAEELRSEVQNKSIEQQRMFVYGGLVALAKAYKWDKVGQSTSTEENILWMFTQLYVR